MEPFEDLSLIEQVRRERVTRARARQLRNTLRAQRNLMEARLEERRLALVLSRPGLARATEEARGMVANLYVQRRATFLTAARHSILSKGLAEKTLKDLRQTLGGGGES